MESYPSTQTIADTKSNQDWLPNLLQTFMEAMIADEVKQASIGQAIVYAARPRSLIPPILFGTAVELDHVFGSKRVLESSEPSWLLCELL